MAVSQYIYSVKVLLCRGLLRNESHQKKSKTKSMSYYIYSVKVLLCRELSRNESHITLVLQKGVDARVFFDGGGESNDRSKVGRYALGGLARVVWLHSQLGL